MLRTVVDLSFLTLAVVLVTVLLSDRYDSNTSATTSLEIQNLRKDVLEVGMRNTMHLEGKINRVAESSDTYQVNTDHRVKVLETRMEMLEEKRDKNSQRIINNNTAINNK